MPSHARSAFNSRNPLHVEIEMQNLNLQVTLPQCKKMWERRSHPTTPLRSPFRKTFDGAGY